MAFRYQRLTRALLDDIQKGRWQAGDMLPSVRQLMQRLQLSRATVLHALGELEAQGWVEAQPRRGYFVNPRPAKAPTATPSSLEAAPRLLSIDDVVHDVMLKGAAFDLLPAESRFDAKPPAIELLHRAISRAMRHTKGAQHQHYEDPAGLPELRDTLAHRLRQQGCTSQAADIVVTHGCQHALLLALKSCTQPGDVVAVESPGYFGTLQLLQELGLKVLELPCDPATGLNPADVAKALTQWPITALVLTPSFATPTGALMPLEARLALAALAKQHRLTLIEDHIYAELSFSSAPLPPMLALAPEHTLLCSSFSKSLSRDLRLGYVAGPAFTKRLAQLKQITSLASNRLIEQGLDEFIRRGDYDRHLRREQQSLRVQRNALLDLLAQHFSDCHHRVPDGGLCLWLNLEPELDTLALYQRARQEGIMITPGPMFTSQQGLYRHCLRLSFAHPWSGPRRQALARLRVLVDGLKRGGKSEI
ncbi:PLP-dependent aminotransferase family protein [Gallaecimonas pentaromativorans]|uniref:GntR family transcriptional regulator n=1 Tax=Gallaecimonas pentaromativorans TaxID=584787 RepID=A0A3N1PNX4_9GAMM|nr:PLP-dependent aminotransferase family protein [Gallaecimonas pentaromativorans]ROQ29668.1 GntR family transcriptional regulator [Gallaecimonas pentaromativorans]